MDNPIHKIALNNLLKEATELSLNIGHVNVLRKRSKSQQKCNNTLEDGDNEFKLNVIKQVECIPTYWTHILDTNSSIRICSKSDEVAKAYQLITDFKRVVSSYEPPCVEMKIPVTVHQQQVGNRQTRLKLYVFYTTDDFQEIVNVKDFDVDTLWSSIGGFIGIFLGYSLLQIPEILGLMWSNSWNRFTMMSWLRYVWEIIISFLWFQSIKCHIL